MLITPLDTRLPLCQHAATMNAHQSWQNQLKHLRHGVLGCMALLWVLAAGPEAGAQSRVDDLGRLDRLAMGPGWARATTEVRVYLKGWSNHVSLSSAPDAKLSTNAEARIWTGTLAPKREQGPAVQVVQTVREQEGKLVFDVQATGLREGDIEGVIFLVNLPAEDFAGGSLRAGGKSVGLPEKLPQNIYLWSGQAGTLLFADAPQRTRISVAAAPALNVTVQDGRKWGQEFTTMFFVQRGNLAKGQSAQATFTLAAAGQPDQTPARASVDPSQVRYRVAGMGGNYCFAIESPVTRHTLEHLQVRAARTEMSLKLWAPRQLAGDLSSNDYSPYAAADTPNSRIRRELELMQEIQRKG
ncbi:MAG TPA: hypothetical protein VNT26_19640, partial [Candidatus Sulfotelmatobacter sp.]|nr:hypothetical protein [Candidatus Sulfotelmatobacter sp.]